MTLHKVIERNLSLIIQTPIFEWFMVRCGLENRCQNHTCLAKIGLSVQKLCTYGSLAGTLGNSYQIRAGSTYFMIELASPPAFTDQSF